MNTCRQGCHSGFLLIVTIMLSLTACSPFAPASREPAALSLPAGYSLYSAQPPESGAWWQEFASPAFDGVVERVLADNLTLQESWARLQQARATARSVAAARWPDLSYEGQASHQRSQNDGETIVTQEQFAATLLSSYELDLWGRVNAAVRAQQQTMLAQREDWLTQRMSLAAQAAETWVEMTAQKQLLPLSEQQLVQARQRLALYELRFAHGQATAEDLSEQRQRVAEYETARLSLEEQHDQLAYALSVLTGRPPSRMDEESAPLPVLAALPAPGVPADLLAQRPDVRAAGLRLQAADWYVAAAQADRLPTVRLSASVSSDSERLRDLFDNWLANLAASVTGPLFDAGARAAEVERTRAVVAERLASYRQAVLTAMQEVETALMQEQKRQDRWQAVTRQLQQQQQLCEQLRQRYLAGEKDYLNLLVAQQTRLTLCQQQIEARRDLLLARIALHRALGGRVPLAQQETTP